MGKNPKSRQSNLVVQEMETEILVYDLHINKVFCLNETAKLVFQLCDGRSTVSEISRSLSQKLKTLVSEDLVRLTINDLSKNGLMEKTGENTQQLTSQTRREMIKRVGLTSMIALPIISSIVAPKALMAQSGAGGFPLGNTCTSSSQCQSGHCLTTTDIFTGFPVKLCCVPDSGFPPGYGLGCFCDASLCCSGMVDVGPLCGPPGFNGMFCNCSF